MNRLLLTSALAASLAFGTAATAQTSPPVGGPAAKGNAPLKHTHTVNDGSAKPGANSFTQGQARQHMMNSGYTDVSGLAKGKDGVWRGTAMHNGASVSVAMDFKGNVTEGAAGGAPMSGPAAMTGAPAPAGPGQNGQSASDMGASGSPAAADGARHVGMRHHHHRHHHLRRRGHCASPGANGAACSGVSTMENGVSDREAKAQQSGAHP